MGYRTIEFTKHARDRMTERVIHQKDVVAAMRSGVIIELKQDAKPCPCCLILGKARSGDPLHVAVAFKEGCLLVLTTYQPEVEFWGENLDKKVVK